MITIKHLYVFDCCLILGALYPSSADKSLIVQILFMNSHPAGVPHQASRVQLSRLQQKCIVRNIQNPRQKNSVSYIERIIFVEGSEAVLVWVAGH